MKDKTTIPFCMLEAMKRKRLAFINAVKNGDIVLTEEQKHLAGIAQR